MRSSKSRQRNKPNRNRTVGNVVNRVFDSSGPEGKVRGTPQQIIEKYNQLARDAQLSGDRVATENFQQHAEHYLRLLGEAQKEQDARREEQERFNRDRQTDRDRERGDRPAGREADEGDRPQPYEPTALSQPDVIGGFEDRDSGLVETPESKPQAEPVRRSEPSRRHPPAPAPAPDAVVEQPAEQGSDAGAEKAAPKRPRKPRAKRVPKSEGNGSSGDGGGDHSTKAAE
ncbi:DUF4167 domain-containing protein [Roseovarius sp. BRH_c41]|uniref:DUF4167 domain-containing protein n=1 Tax=Roseovarius sp. BRH_c41 TaxID=1629709 RepID=UPI0005F1F153|nr:DUF4167 domain-containing protein [Roseovarius sp. BRH_c41]KJS45001.1 MAG: hypothetical protein VR71_03345 [Roseovarius sp. BRH_c41]